MELLKTMDAISETFRAKEPKETWEKIANDWHNKVSLAFVTGELEDIDRKILHSMIDTYYKVRTNRLNISQLV